jgi:hypothetical protein
MVGKGDRDFPPPRCRQQEGIRNRVFAKNPVSGQAQVCECDGNGFVSIEIRDFFLIPEGYGERSPPRLAADVEADVADGLSMGEID